MGLGWGNYLISVCRRRARFQPPSSRDPTRGTKRAGKRSTAELDRGHRIGTRRPGALRGRGRDKSAKGATYWPRGSLARAHGQHQLRVLSAQT